MAVRVVGDVPLDIVEMDRWPRLDARLAGLLAHLAGGGTVPPVKLTNLGDGKFRIKDGRHRMAAYVLLGRPTIRAAFSTKVFGRARGVAGDPRVRSCCVGWRAKKAT